MLMSEEADCRFFLRERPLARGEFDMSASIKFTEDEGERPGGILGDWDKDSDSSQIRDIDKQSGYRDTKYRESVRRSKRKTNVKQALEIHTYGNAPGRPVKRPDHVWDRDDYRNNINSVNQRGKTDWMWPFSTMAQCCDVRK
jgi:hypothetical protein